jgi:CO dehydrogenase nickel-insertion accessory protein CooC1
VTAVLFAREGAKVLAVDIDLDAALETKQIVEQSAASVKQSRSTYRVPPTSPP